MPLRKRWRDGIVPAHLSGRPADFVLVCVARVIALERNGTFDEGHRRTGDTFEVARSCPSRRRAAHNDSDPVQRPFEGRGRSAEPEGDRS
ncbi:hypothetical protein CHELA40_11667 [Chelatococcus asaccharovorans]|nr:hypothetical protein CHELA40_11667 [Chelatococcus asaccharovorans]CAH1684309.1 hypothetical protein CHELA17_63935 [Chelatococcus asaccharovorans]